MRLSMDKILGCSISLIFAFALIVFGVAPAFTGSIADMKILETRGQWQLRMGVDNMSDKRSCVIINTLSPQIQIDEGGVYVSYSGRGGIQGYRYRLGDGPATEIRIVSDLEKRVGAIIFGGADFQAILQSNRLRISAYTILDTLIDEDFDLSEARYLYGSFNTNCLGVASAGSPQNPNADNSVAEYSTKTDNSEKPSFDCSKVTRQDEITICKNIELTHLDNILSFGFDYLKSNIDRKKAIKLGGEFIAKRRACGGNAECIRLASLKAISKYQQAGAPVSIP